MSRADIDGTGDELPELAVASRERAERTARSSPSRTTRATRWRRTKGRAPPPPREARLAPEAFEGGGGVTAGNSCPLNDGAAAILIMSDSKANELGLDLAARMIAAATGRRAGVRASPIGAIKKVLDRAGMTIEDVDVSS